MLVARCPDHYRLLAAKHLVTTDQSIPLDGEIEIPRETVVYLQRLGKAQA